MEILNPKIFQEKNCEKVRKDQNQEDLKAQKQCDLRALGETEVHCSTWAVLEYS